MQYTPKESGIFWVTLSNKSIESSGYVVEGTHSTISKSIVATLGHDSLIPTPPVWLDLLQNRFLVFPSYAIHVLAAKRIREFLRSEVPGNYHEPLFNPLVALMISDPYKRASTIPGHWPATNDIRFE